eukprot:gene11286-4097_t
MSEEKKKRKYDKRSSWLTYFEEVVKGEEAKCTIVGCSDSKVEFNGYTTLLKRHMEKHNKEILIEKGFYSVESIDRKYISINLGTVLAEEDHISGEILAEHYNSLYKEFGIENSQIIEVIDGGSNLKNAAAILKHKNIHCNCHALQLPIKTGLLEICITKEMFQDCPIISTKFSALKKLRAAQLQNNSKDLVLLDDNDTRWNSFLQMIERIHKLKEDLRIAFELIKNDKLIKTKVENLSEEEYGRLEFLIKFLTPFRTASKYFEKSYVNSNISISGMVPVIGNLINHCQKIKKEIKGGDVLNMMEAIEEKMIDEWKNIDILFYATAFVNPILKTLSFLTDEMKEQVVKYIELELNKIEILDEELKKEEKEKEFQYFENLYGIKFQRTTSQNNELINYVNELPQDPSENILAYWKTNSKKYPKLCSSANVERDWSFVDSQNMTKNHNITIKFMTIDNDLHKITKNPLLSFDLLMSFSKICVWDVGQGSCSTLEILGKPVMLIDLSSSRAPETMSVDWKKTLLISLFLKLLEENLLK